MGRKLTEIELLEHQERRKKSLEKSSALLGIPAEEIERLEAKARAELEKEGSDWEKELDARNKSRSGITTDPNEFVPKRKTANGENPYEVERNALSLLQELHTGYDKSLEVQILSLFESIEKCLYPNRLALNYKLLGDTLAELNMEENAMKAYETGLTLNPNLPVKKKLQALKRANAI